MATSAVYGSNAWSMAQEASGLTQLSPYVILSQWYAENGTNALHQMTWSNFGYNPGNIRPGNSEADALALHNRLGNVQTSPGGFDVFPTAQAGMQAYANVMNQANMNNVRQAATNHQFSYEGTTYTGDNAQLVALAASPWDSGHYAGNSGQMGTNLVSAYSTITGKPDQVALPAAPVKYPPLLNKKLPSSLANLDQRFSLTGSVWGMLTGNLSSGFGILLRGIFLILGILFIAFAVLNYVNQKVPIAKVASTIAPLLAE